jgi:hypothetical protein
VCDNRCGEIFHTYRTMHSTGKTKESVDSVAERREDYVCIQNSQGERRDGSVKGVSYSDSRDNGVNHHQHQATCRPGEERTEPVPRDDAERPCNLQPSRELSQLRNSIALKFKLHSIGCEATEAVRSERHNGGCPRDLNNGNN